MEWYSFTLRVEGIDIANERYEDALFESGCDDALVSVVDGAMFIDFTREAPNFDSAVASAKSCVESAGGRVVDVEAIPSQSSEPHRRDNIRA